MRFKVYARQMYCGTLLVLPSGMHVFCNRQQVMEGCNRGISLKVKAYVGLSLVRVDSLSA